MLSIGTKAPNFAVQDETKTKRTLSDYAGKWTVIYFYPKDDTPGCTKEACGIAEIYNDFEGLGVAVVGVSKDTPAAHVKFKEKYHLPFTLLADESTEMIQSYGAWVEKSMFGKQYMGIDRVTYILNPDGEIAKVYPNVSPDVHALQLLTDLKELTTT